MTRYYNRQEQKPKRQRLRNDATKAERLLWSRLKHSQLDRIKFRRQAGVGEYVIDLYCPEVKLAVEADGESHFDPVSREYDSRRLAFLQSFGIRVLRFTNPQVYDQLDWVIDEIWHAAKERKAQLLAVRGGPPLVPPYQGGRQLARKRSASNEDGPQAPLLNKEGVGGGRSAVSRTSVEKDPPQSPLGNGGDGDPPMSPLSKEGGS